MYLQKARTQKVKSEHQLDKKNSRTSKISHGLKSDVFPRSSMGINYSRATRTEHVFIPHIYNGKREYNWKERKEFVERAISDAIVHLENASKDPLVQDYQIIKNAIQDVIQILKNPILELYPFFGKSDGLAMKDEYKISIRTTLIKDALEKEESLYRLEKTLIHESFHIIGGCTSASIDVTCSDSIPKKGAFKLICSITNIIDMTADYFAQFVMQC